MKPAADVRPDQGTPSIASRLTFLYLLAALAILVASSAFLYWILSTEIDRENRQLVQTLLSVLTEDAEEPDAHFLLPGMDSAKQPYQLRVFDQNMRVLASSAAMHDIPFPERGADADTILERDVGSSRYMSAANWTHKREGVPVRMVQVAVETTDDKILLAHYRRAAFLVLLGGLAACAFASFRVVRRGLRSLRDVTEATERITATQLHERLVTAEWPRELMDLAAAFNLMLGRLDRAFQRLSQSSYNLAHELRTPINNLIGEAGVALSRARNADEYRRTLESALEEYERLAKIVDTLLFFARIDNPHHKLPVEALDAATELRKVIDFFESVAEENGVQINLSGNAQITANQTLFGQAVGNVLNNALQHTAAGGAVNIEVLSGPANIEVSIQDTGSGIDAADLPHVTEQFYRTATSRAARLGGMGLGLSIVKSIVEWHRGTMEISSAMGQGTRVRLVFPQNPQFSA